MDTSTSNGQRGDSARDSRKKKLPVHTDSHISKKSRSTEDVMLKYRARNIFKLYRQDSLKDGDHVSKEKNYQMEGKKKRSGRNQRSPLACAFPEQASDRDCTESPTLSHFNFNLGHQLPLPPAIESDGFSPDDSKCLIESDGASPDIEKAGSHQDNKEWIMKARDLRKLGDEAGDEVKKEVDKIAQKLICTKAYEAFQEIVESLIDNSAPISSDVSDRSRLALLFLCVNTAANLVMKEKKPQTTTEELEDNIVTFIANKFPDF